MAARRKRGPIEAATLRSIDPILRKGGLAMMALDLARTLDERDPSASAQAAVARELRVALSELASLDARVVPEGAKETTKPEGDKVDELKRRRAARRATPG
jgi:hypothetical protein